MKLTLRQQRIIQQLANNDTITSDSLSKSLGFSSRTIREEIKIINSATDIPVIISLKSKGFKLNIANPDIELYLGKNETSAEYINTRNTNILKAILSQDNLDYYELADEFYISESTLDKVINDFNNIIQKRYPAISILRKNNTIIVIPNDEQTKRNIFSSFLIQEMHNYNFNISNYNFFFNSCNLDDLSNFVIAFNKKHHLNMRDFEIFAFTLHIAILIERSQNSSFVQINNEKYDISYLASKFKEEIATELHINIPDEELVQLSLLISGKISKITYESVNNLTVFIDQMIIDINKIYNFDLLDNEQFKSNLLVHLLGLESRIRTNSYILNPLIKDIKVHFPILYDISVYIAINIQKKYNCILLEDEIGYITLHLMNAIDISQNKNEKTLIIISSLGKAESLFIKKKLFDYLGKYTLTIIKSLSISNARECINDKVDLIISTMPLNFITKSPIYITQGILNAQDLEKITKLLDNPPNQNNLKKYFDEKLFFVDKDFASKEEIIHFLCQQLVQNGYCTPEFEEKVLKRETVAPTTYGNLFAIPHPIEKCALKNIVAVCILSSPIIWQGQKTKLVLLFALSTKQDPSFNEMFEKLVSLLNDVNNVKELCKQTTLSSFLEIFTS